MIIFKLFSFVILTFSLFSNTALGQDDADSSSAVMPQLIESVSTAELVERGRQIAQSISAARLKMDTGVTQAEVDALPSEVLDKLDTASAAAIDFTMKNRDAISYLLMSTRLARINGELNRRSLVAIEAYLRENAVQQSYSPWMNPNLIQMPKQKEIW